MQARLLQPLVFAILCLLHLCLAQTITTTDENGATIVEVVTNDANGVPNTAIISTIAPADGADTTDPADAGDVTPTPNPSASASNSSPTGTPTDNGDADTPPPVTDHQINGQPGPAATGAGGPTPFDYITTIDGVRTVVHDTFTPTFPAVQTVVAPSSGSIMPYSQYLASVSMRGGGAAQMSFGWAWGLAALLGGAWVLS